MYLINLSDRIAKVMMVFAAVWAFGLSFLIVADALSRSFLNFPLNGTKDIVENSIVIIIFLQAGYAIRSRSMLQSDILLSRLPLKIKKIMLLIGYLLGMFFFYVMISGSWDIAIQAFVEGEYEGEGALKVPTWPTRFMIIIGSVFCFLNYIVLAITDVFGIEDREGF
jgi:TRAP-type C4-dicarboxylate transport system permease small subunit